MTATDLQDIVDSGSFVQFDTPVLIGSLRGSGPDVSRLVYTGPPDPDGALKVRAGERSFRLEGFTLTGTAGCGLSVGCDKTGPPQGTQASGSIDFVQLFGWDVGLRVGDPAGYAASEMVYRKLVAQNCGTGIWLQQWNTLSHRFEMLDLSGCDVGIEGGEGGNVVVDSGTATNAGTVFRFKVGGAHELNFFRAEGADLFAQIGGHTSRCSVRMNRCSNAARRLPGVDVLVVAGGTLYAEGCSFEGGFEYRPAYDGKGKPIDCGSVRLIDCEVGTPELLTCPSDTPLTWEVRGCVQVDGSGQIVKRFPDGAGYVWPPSQGDGFHTIKGVLANSSPYRAPSDLAAIARSARPSRNP